jgi:hypothetical protein
MNPAKVVRSIPLPLLVTLPLALLVYVYGKVVVFPAWEKEEAAMHATCESRGMIVFSLGLLGDTICLDGDGRMHPSRLLVSGKPVLFPPPSKAEEQMRSACQDKGMTLFSPGRFGDTICLDSEGRMHPLARSASRAQGEP